MTISIGILAMLHIIRRTTARILRDYRITGALTLTIPGILKLKIKAEPKTAGKTRITRR